jgi:uncharacterized glyoxalase superfamily protein PhnB
MICPILCVKDIPLSIVFYEKLGFQRQMAMTGPDGLLAFAFVGLGKDTTIGLSRSSDIPKTPHIDFMIYVPDGEELDTYYNRAKARGIAIAEELKTQEWGDHVFTVVDPNGYRIMLSQRVQKADLDRLATATREVAKVVSRP